MASEKRARHLNDEMRELRFKNETKDALVKCVFCQQMLPKNYQEIQAHVDAVHGEKRAAKPAGVASAAAPTSNPRKRSHNKLDVADDILRTTQRPDRHYCQICSRGFDFAHRLVAHMELVHRRLDDGSNTHACDICGREFRFARQVENHATGQHSGVLYCCVACGASFSLSQHLETHLRKKHEGLLYGCKVCGKTFVCTYDLQTHVDVTHKFEANDKLLVCRKCGRNFAFISALEEHERSHDKTVKETTIRLPALPKGFLFVTSKEGGGERSDC